MHWTAGFRLCFISDVTDPPLVMSIVRHDRSVVNNTPDRPTQKSILLPLGIALISLGLVLPIALGRVAQDMQPGTLRSVCFFWVDLFRACFFAGIAFLVFGVLRNRKSKPPPPKSQV
jgi:hypothetical protein